LEKDKNMMTNKRHKIMKKQSMLTARGFDEDEEDGKVTIGKRRYQ